MDKDVVRLHELLHEGKCCSCAVVQIGLELIGDENPQLIEAVSSLCKGVRSNLICGALTGAACMMNVVSHGKANAEMIPELVEWFESTYTDLYGGINCSDILGNNQLNRTMICPSVVEDTYLQAKSILESYGYDFN